MNGPILEILLLWNKSSLDRGEKEIQSRKKMNSCFFEPKVDTFSSCSLGSQVHLIPQLLSFISVRWRLRSSKALRRITWMKGQSYLDKVLKGQKVRPYLLTQVIPLRTYLKSPRYYTIGGGKGITSWVTGTFHPLMLSSEITLQKFEGRTLAMLFLLEQLKAAWLINP